VADSDDRRETDRRKTVDLTRPAHLERRQPGVSGRDEDKERFAEQQAQLPLAARRPVDLSDPPVPSKPLAELESDLQRLEALMEERNKKLHGLSAEEFEVALARDAEVMKQWAAQVRRLRREIAVARGETAE
jgi:hypothetical protein